MDHNMMIPQHDGMQMGWILIQSND